MELTRIYDEKDLERYRLEREQAMQEWRLDLKGIGVPARLVEPFARQICDDVVAAPALAGVDIIHTGVQAEQHFSTPLVTEFIQLGIMSIHDNQLMLKTATEDLRYTIRREPGRWCLHCGEKLAGDANGEMARLHIAMKHKDTPSPVANNPAGYEWITYFDCVLDQAQHDQYKKRA